MSQPTPVQLPSILPGPRPDGVDGAATPEEQGLADMADDRPPALTDEELAHQLEWTTPLPAGQPG